MMFKKYLQKLSLLLIIILIVNSIAFLVATISANTALAEKLITLIWINLVVYGFSQIVSLNSNNLLNTWIDIDSFLITIYSKYWKRIASNRYRKLIFALLSISVIILSGFSNFYNLGGDDSRLYYVYPGEFLNFALRVGPNTSVSSLATFLPPSCLVLFAGLMVVLRILVGNLNLQAMLYTANILGGIWGFYLLTNYIFGNQSKYSSVLRLLFGFMYVYSIFIFYTLFNSQLIALFLVSTFPISIYCYFRGIKEKKKYLLLITALIWTIFCYLSVALPWFAGIMLVLLPLIMYYFRKNIVQFVIYNIFFGVVLLLFNLHWLIALPYTYSLNENNKTVSSISSVNFRSQNEQGIKAVSEHNTVFYPLLNSYHYDIQKNFNWPFLTLFEKWYARIIFINIVWFAIVLIGVKMYKIDQQKGLISSIVTGFIMAVFFFTAKVGNWGLPLFTLLSNSVPGFVMFRNMYDKFGFALSFMFALTVLICTEIIFKQAFSERAKRLLLFVLGIILFMNAIPYLFGRFQNLPIWTTTTSFDRTDKLNHDYLALAQFIKTQPSSSRYVWLPLNYGNVSQIPDENFPTNYYNGVSPLIFFSGKNDYSGITSFEKYGQNLADDINNRRYASIGKFFQEFNVGYVIVNNTVSDELLHSYLCGEEICSMQDANYKKILLGEKIKDFGERYSLYKIQDSFANDKFYLSDTLQSVKMISSVQYEQISNYEYAIKLQHISSTDYLVFLDQFSPHWNFFTHDGKTALNLGQQVSAFEYANAWRINTHEIEKLSRSYYQKNTDGTINITLRLRFELGILFYFIVFVSLFSIAIASSYCALKGLKVLSNVYNEKI